MSQDGHFDVAALFDADEYLYFLAQTLEDEDTPAQCAFIESALALSPNSRVLDLGCGHGRHSIELARRGHRPVGIDLVPGFIERARAEAAREGLSAAFVCGDMRAFDSPPEFDAAICLFDVFGYHVDAEHALILDRCLAALRPGGRLLLDVRTREHFVRSAPVSLVEMGNGDLMIDRFQFDVESGRMIVRRTYLRDGRQREDVFSVRLYAYTELRDLLLARGFQVLRSCGGYDGAPLSASRPRTLVVAGKPLSVGGRCGAAWTKELPGTVAAGSEYPVVPGPGTAASAGGEWWPTTSSRTARFVSRPPSGRTSSS